jgi:hypothetical protein
MRHDIADNIQALQGEDGTARAEAARALAAAGADAVGALLPLLADPRPAVRAEVASVLGRIGPPAERAAPALHRLSPARLPGPAAPASPRRPVSGSPAAAGPPASHWLQHRRAESGGGGRRAAGAAAPRVHREAGATGAGREDRGLGRARTQAARDSALDLAVGEGLLQPRDARLGNLRAAVR